MYIVKIPFINGLSRTKGCEKAPNLILEKLRDIHSNERGVFIDELLLDLEEIHVDNSNSELSNSLVCKNSRKDFETKNKTVFLGGDHSLSFSTCSAFLDYCSQKEKEPCLIVFDAHADAMPAMKEPTHEEWLRALVEKGFPAENILLVGARNIEKSERVFLRESGIKLVPMQQLQENLRDSCDIIMEFSKGKELYVSIDIDVIDPAFAPGTGFCEPGGLTSREFIYLVSRINKLKNLKAIDIVEINPEKDNNGLTVKLGAKILGELI